MANISVNPTSLSFGWKGGSEKVTVTSSTSWMMSFDSTRNPWCYPTKSGNTMTVATEWNLGTSTKNTGISAATSSTAAAVAVSQSPVPSTYVKYNVLSKVNRYGQPSGNDCAATCLCMCIKQPPQTVKNAHPSLYEGPNGVIWDKLAEEYGYKCDNPKRIFGSEADRLKLVLDQLKLGYPVIVKVNDPVQTQHWAVVVGYAAPSASTALSASIFLCLDPFKLKNSTLAVPLNNVTNYVNIYSYTPVIKL